MLLLASNTNFCAAQWEETSMTGLRDPMLLTPLHSWFEHDLGPRTKHSQVICWSSVHHRIRMTIIRRQRTLRPRACACELFHSKEGTSQQRATPPSQIGRRRLLFHPLAMQGVQIGSRQRAVRKIGSLISNLYVPGGLRICMFG